MKKIIQLLLPLMSIILLLGGAELSFASENADYGIVITKYKVSNKKELETLVPTDGKKAEELKTPTGETLATLPGVSYQITRVSPTDGITDFQPVKGPDAFSQTITTNNEGVAAVSGLAAGTYRVIELDDKLLKEVMEPVILELPLPQRDGPALSTVYLYPKSGVVLPDTPPKENPPTSPNKPGTVTPGGSHGGSSNGSRTAAAKKTADKIPQTSGNIGNYQPFVLVFGFLLAIAAGGFYMMKKSSSLY